MSTMTMDSDGGSPAAWTYLKVALENGQNGIFYILSQFFKKPKNKKKGPV